VSARGPTQDLLVGDARREGALGKIVAQQFEGRVKAFEFRRD